MIFGLRFSLSVSCSGFAVRCQYRDCPLGTYSVAVTAVLPAAWSFDALYSSFVSMSFYVFSFWGHYQAIPILS
jgi:hypothetical protein